MHFQVTKIRDFVFFEFHYQYFASGNNEVVHILLEAGAKTHQTNRIGRTAAQLAAFTGQKECVDTINNYVTLEDLKYYITPQGLSHVFLFLLQ